MLSTRGVGAFLFWISSLTAVTRADSLVESVSFGVNKQLSPNGQYNIPGWQLFAEGHAPEILSDRVILTPPYPGGKRGALWTDKPSSQSEWSVEFQFRANGEERASGNLQLWYVKDGLTDVGTASIYTVRKFDGFALTIDTHGGRGGSIRGFLNDGMTDYKHHANVDSLAFGHCSHSYRNLGHPSRVLIRQSAASFEVFVNDEICFKTDKVTLPPGNHFGISAASAENPDSFEIFKFALSTPDSSSGGNSGYRPYQAESKPGRRDTNSGSSGDVAALQYQIDGLQARVASLDSAANRILNEITQLAEKSDERHTELFQRAAARDQVVSMDQRLQRLEKVLESVQKEVASRDYQAQFRTLQDAVQRSHAGLFEHVQTTSNALLSSTPRMGLFIFLILAFQVLLAGVYVYYKKRRANMPKKFL